MTDSHQQLEAWLVDGAVGDPPRELAVHAAVCPSCAARIGAFDSLARIDVGAIGSPPPLAPPTRLMRWLLGARLATAVAGTVAAAVLVVFGASQLIGFVGGFIGQPDASVLVGLASQTPEPPDGSRAPEPAAEPSATSGPAATPIPTFIPLPSAAPDAQPLAPPNAPSLSLAGVGPTAITIQWFPSAGGGPVQKWEVWNRIGSGAWFKLGEVFPGELRLTHVGLSPGTPYSYRVRGVNVSAFGAYSNEVSATTPPAPTPTPPPTPLPTVEPTPTPAPTPAPQCNDGIDNDDDGYTDGADPECSSSGDDDESPPNSHECNDQIDNDGDHLVDVGEDPACSGPFDDSEGPLDLIYQCNDGLDNELVPDGLRDFGEDPQCSSWTDDDETL